MSDGNNISSKNLISRTTIYLIVIAVLLIAMCIMNYRLIPFALFTLTAIIVYTNWSIKKRKAEFSEELKDLTLDVNTTAKTTLINSPFPLAMCETNGKMIWKSVKYVSEFNNTNIDEALITLLKQIKVIIGNSEKDDKGDIETSIVVGNKHYTVLGTYVKSKKKKRKQEYTTILYFIEDTEYRELKKASIDKEICFGEIMIDNYEEINQRISSEVKTLLMAQMEKQIYDWANKYGAVLIKTERDTFECIIEKSKLLEAKEDKISILNDIKAVDLPDVIQPTLSIAFSNDGEDNIEKLRSVNAVINIALGRGGDQAIVKIDGKYEFFGGRSQEIEKRTKVKSRMISHALQELIASSDNVIIMGHSHSDMDAIGASLGIYRLAKFLNVEAKIVKDSHGVGIEKFIDEAKKSEEYVECFTTLEDVKDIITEKSLLVVVDTNKKTYVEAPELLEKIPRVVVIDHHRRSTDDIENPMLIFHEVYASSASELVTEILEYSQVDVKPTQMEMEALYSGIMLDTKNFTFKTGVRTFEAAAYLRKCGVDIIKVKKWFQNDLETFQTISRIVSNAEIMNDDIAISIYDEENNEDDANSNIIIAKAADELLTIGGIVASFVLGKVGDKVYISGRSIGDINVQLILEKLGGGGHITLAGAQVKNMTVEEAKQELINRINEYFFEIEE